MLAFEGDFQREPTDAERLEINSCGYQRMCVDEVVAYRCPVLDCNGSKIQANLTTT